MAQLLRVHDQPRVSYTQSIRCPAHCLQESEDQLTNVATLMDISKPLDIHLWRECYTFLIEYSNLILVCHLPFQPPRMILPSAASSEHENVACSKSHTFTPREPCSI
jgi:hypothetical protein